MLVLSLKPKDEPITTSNKLKEKSLMTPRITTYLYYTIYSVFPYLTDVIMYAESFVNFADLSMQMVKLVVETKHFEYFELVSKFRRLYFSILF